MFFLGISIVYSSETRRTSLEILCLSDQERVEERIQCVEFSENGEPRSLRLVSWLPNGMKSRLHRMVERVPLAFRGKNDVLREFSPIEQHFYGNARLQVGTNRLTQTA